MTFVEFGNFNRPTVTKWNNDLYTPPEGFEYIRPFLPKEWVYWEMCYGRGLLADAMRNKWFNVVGDGDLDCFSEPLLIDGKPFHFDYIITNPPYSNNKDFIKRCLELWKPFAILFRLEHLGWVGAYELFKDQDFEIIIPKKRINFISETNYQRFLNGEPMKKSSSSFHTIWLTKGFNIWKPISWIDLPKD